MVCCVSRVTSPQEALHQKELSNEQREHAETKEDLAKKVQALHALRDQLTLKDREVAEARKRTENKDKLLKQTMAVLRKEQDALRDKVRLEALTAARVAWPSHPRCAFSLTQMRAVTTERDELAQLIKVRDEKLENMNVAVGVAKEELRKNGHPPLTGCGWVSI